MVMVMDLLYVVCAYLAACYLFGAYFLIRIITGSRLRCWLLRMTRPFVVRPASRTKLLQPISQKSSYVKVA